MRFTLVEWNKNVDTCSKFFIIELADVGTNKWLERETKTEVKSTHSTKGTK